MNILNGKQHISILSIGLSGKLGFLYRTSKYLPLKQLNYVYFAIIQSVFDYALTVWGSPYHAHLNLLQRMQN